MPYSPKTESRDLFAYALITACIGIVIWFYTRETGVLFAFGSLSGAGVLFGLLWRLLQ